MNLCKSTINLASSDCCVAAGSTASIQPYQISAFLGPSGSSHIKANLGLAWSSAIKMKTYAENAHASAKAYKNKLLQYAAELRGPNRPALPLRSCRQFYCRDFYLMALSTVLA